jgi:hypothetical protein
VACRPCWPVRRAEDAQGHVTGGNSRSLGPSLEDPGHPIRGLSGGVSVARVVSPGETAPPPDSGPLGG